MFIEVSHAAIAHRASAGGNNSSSSSVVINKPTGTVDGDVMLAIIDINDASATITAPSGWTLLDSVNSGGLTAKIATYYKVASSEGSSYTWSFSVTNRNAGAIVSFSGVDTGSPVDVHNSQLDTDLNTSFQFASMTTSNANEMAVGLVSFDDVTARTFTEPSGYSESIDQNVGSGCQIVYKIFSSAGATGGQTGTISSGTANLVAFHVALKEASVASSSTTILYNATTYNGTVY